MFISNFSELHLLGSTTPTIALSLSTPTFIYRKNAITLWVLNDPNHACKNRLRLHRSGCGDLQKNITHYTENDKTAEVKEDQPPNLHKQENPQINPEKEEDPQINSVNKENPQINLENNEEDSLIRRLTTSLYDFDPLNLKKDKNLLDDKEVGMLECLESFHYKHRFENGAVVEVKFLQREYMDNTEEVLTDSFVDIMWWPLTYRPLLRLTVRENMLERRAFVPHAATLVALYSQNEGEWMMGGTVELSFNARGNSKRLPTPIPPKAAPYLCNMAVAKDLRRRGIGWHLLKASEELVQQMGLNEIYLHCRVIDSAPLGMYRKAGYNVVKTDTVFALLTLQRRRHLMFKKLDRKVDNVD